MRVDTINKEAEQKEDRKRTQQSHLTTALAGLVCVPLICSIVFAVLCHQPTLQYNYTVQFNI